MRVGVYVCVCACMCVWEGGRVCVCMCVCVSVGVCVGGWVCGWVGVCVAETRHRWQTLTMEEACGWACDVMRVLSLRTSDCRSSLDGVGCRVYSVQYRV